MNHKRVERLWRREGLKVPAKQPKRRRLWLTDGSCVRLRPTEPNHVWSYDFVFTRTSDGRPLRLLTVLDEFTRECLAIQVARQITSDDVLAELAQLLVERGTPRYLRSDNGPEFTARALRTWLERVGVQTLYIEPGSPWENGYIELTLPPKTSPGPMLVIRGSGPEKGGRRIGQAASHGRGDHQQVEGGGGRAG